jgi:hypothetical protein
MPGAPGALRHRYRQIALGIGAKLVYYNQRALGDADNSQAASGEHNWRPGFQAPNELLQNSA